MYPLNHLSHTVTHSHTATHSHTVSCTHKWPIFLVLITALMLTASLQAATEKHHGFALYDQLKYPQNFTHFEFVNPAAPKGGKLKLMGVGTFDSLNPYQLKGISPWRTPGLHVYGFGQLHDTLLAGTGSLRPSGDEPSSAYGLIANHLSYPKDHSWVVFHLNPKAQFHDGHPITAEDVIFSFNTLTQDGHPRFQLTYKDIESVTTTHPHSVKFTFKTPNNRALILRAGELPILPKHFFEKQPFSKTGLTPILGNGPYRVASVQPGKTLVLERVKNYWAADLPVNKGRYNFDTVQIDFYRDSAIAFEAFKAGHYDVHLDYVSKNWTQNYGFPALKKGDVVKREISHQQPQGSQAFFFNTRRALFKDKRVREAIGLMFDFEWSNQVLFNNAYQRSLTYFPNSPLGATGLPNPQTLKALAPFKDQLPEQLFQAAFKLPITDGSGNIRAQKRKALQLLKTAGWEIKNNQLISKTTQQPFKFELVNQHSASLGRVITPFQKNLSSIGIELSIRMVDAAQYKTLLDAFDYDMTIYVLPQSLSPGQELRQYFHSEAAKTPGSRNYAGINNAIVDELVEQIIKAKTRDELTTLVRALDRVLLWEHYSIPHWHINNFRLAHWDKFAYPSTQPSYILGTQNWWRK